MEIDQVKVDAFNKDLSALLSKSEFDLGSEVFISEGLIKSKVVIVPKPIAAAEVKPKEDVKPTAKKGK